MKTISAKELDKLFDDGEVDITDYIIPSTIRHPNLERAERLKKAQQRATKEQIVDKQSVDNSATVEHELRR